MIMLWDNPFMNNQILITVEKWHVSNIPDIREYPAWARQYRCNNRDDNEANSTKHRLQFLKALAAAAAGYGVTPHSIIAGPLCVKSVKGNDMIRFASVCPCWQDGGTHKCPKGPSVVLQVPVILLLSTS
jgi:hypothetical protein